VLLLIGWSCQKGWSFIPHSMLAILNLSTKMLRIRKGAYHWGLHLRFRSNLSGESWRFWTIGDLVSTIKIDGMNFLWNGRMVRRFRGKETLTCGNLKTWCRTILGLTRRGRRLLLVGEVCHSLRHEGVPTSRC